MKKCSSGNWRAQRQGWQNNRTGLGKKASRYNGFSPGPVVYAAHIRPVIFYSYVLRCRLGILASEGWREAWRPSHKVQPGGAFSGQTQGWKTSKRTSWWHTASVYAELVHCLGLLGVSSSVEGEFLSVLSYRFLLSVFLYGIVFYRWCCVMYSLFYFRMFLVLVRLSVIVKWYARNTTLMMPFVLRLSPRRPRWRKYNVVVYFFCFVCFTVCFVPGSTQYISNAHGMI